MKSVKAATAAAALTAVAAVLAPPANASMQVGNYDVLTNRYERASWAWFVSACPQPVNLDCLVISGIPRLKFYAYYNGQAHLVDGQYRMTVDVPDGLQCLPGYAMPTHETWTLGPGLACRNHRLPVRRGLFQRPARLPVLDVRAATVVTRGLLREQTQSYPISRRVGDFRVCSPRES